MRGRGPQIRFNRHIEHCNVKSESGVAPYGKRRFENNSIRSSIVAVWVSSCGRLKHEWKKLPKSMIKLNAAKSRFLSPGNRR